MKVSASMSAMKRVSRPHVLAAAGKRMMRWSYLDSRFFGDVLYRSGLSAALSFRYAGIGSIFYFHRVVPDVSACLKRDLYVSTGFLGRFLTAIRKAGVEVVSLNEAVRRIQDPDQKRRRRFVVITFDDGYADNLTHALPILERFEAPFTVYVTTDMIERGDTLQWLGGLGLERLFLENNTVDVLPMGKRFRTASFREKAEALAQVGYWLAADRERASLLRDVFGRYGVSMSAVTSAVGLSREQLRALGRHPLATVGGHTTSHPELARLDESEAFLEISDSKAFLEGVLGVPVDHFAYPFGGAEACGEREAALVVRAGFKTAVTTRIGCLFPEHRDHLLLLPRCAANGRRMWLSFMHAQRHGARRCIESRGGCPVVRCGML